MRRVLLGGLLVVWLSIAFVIWAAGYSGGGGLDGPCYGLVTAQGSDQLSSEGHWQVWPPGSVRCESETAHGVRSSKTFPGTQTYTALFVMALGLVAIVATGRSFGR